MDPQAFETSELYTLHFSSKNTISQEYYDKRLHRQRHKIENMFARLKDWRRIAMRYDRCAHTFGNPYYCHYYFLPLMSPDPTTRTVPPKVQRLSGTVHRLNNGKPFSPSHSKGRRTACEAGTTVPLADVSAAGRGGDRRPKRGGSSDAGRTLVPRERGTAGGRTPAVARQGGGQWYASRIRAVRQGW